MTSSESYEALIQTAIAGLKEIQAKSSEELKKWIAAQSFLPPSIPAGRTSFIITANGLEALRKLGSQWFSNDPKKAASLTKSAAEDVAVAAFEELIDAAKDLPQELDVQNELIRRMEAKVQGQTRREHFYFPAQVFEQEDVTTISVGPVGFDRRTDWLKQVEQVAGAPLPWTKRVLDRWRTAPGLDFANPEPADQQAQTILDAVGPADWVATVVVEGRDRSRSHDCASVAVLIALDSLGLPLDLRSARSLRGPGHLVEARMSHGLSQYDGLELNRSTSVDVPRVGGRPGAQASLLPETRKLRHAVGDALSAFVDVQSAAPALNLKRRWVEAMYWFGQARREGSDFVALVKLGITLDILAKGGKFRGILTMSGAVLGMKDSDPITSDQRSLKSFVKQLYDDSRSQIAHGGRLALLQELPLERPLQTRLPRKCLSDTSPVWRSILDRTPTRILLRPYLHYELCACANVSFARSRNTASFQTRGTRDPESRGKYMLLWIPGFAGMTARLPSWMPGPRPGMTRGRDAG